MSVIFPVSVILTADALLLPLCGLLILGTLLWLNPIPADDTATRYAPMAQALAEGDWLYAFHPHSGVFFPALSGGIAWLTELDGFRACQVAALLLWATAALPLYGIVLKLWGDRRIALLAELLYLAASHLRYHSNLRMQDFVPFCATIAFQSSKSVLF